MDLDPTFFKAIDDEISPAVKRLLEAILSVARKSDGDPLLYAANKEAVMGALAAREGSQPDSAAIRQRLRTLNKVIAKTETFRAGEDSLVKVKSTKDAFQIRWAEGASDLLSRAKTQDAVIRGGHDDYTIQMGHTEPVTSELIVEREFRIFVSHNWESGDANETLDAFICALEVKLKKLPHKYASKFAVELLYDRKSDMRPTASFTDQMDWLCARSDLALFVMSNGWFQSEACKQEAGHFEARDKIKGHHPYFAIQLCDRREDLPPKYARLPSFPSLAAQHFPGIHTLQEMWERPPSEIDKFVGIVRDEICRFLDRLLDTPLSGPGHAVQRNRDIRDFLTSEDFNPDVERKKRIRGFMTENEGDDFHAPETTRRPAVETIVNWAVSEEAQARLMILLGGFGMGKTTTVQLVHEDLRRRLADHPNGPVPIYLDFRRLIPDAENGKKIDLTLAAIIAKTIHTDASHKVSGAQITDLIRNANCVVIFDGLDEVGNKIGRDYATLLYRQLLELIPVEVQAAEAASGQADWKACGTRLIVTCRTHFFRSLREQDAAFSGANRRAPSFSAMQDGSKTKPYLTYYMAPLRLEQIDELFRKYLGEQLGRQTFSLIKQVHDLPGLATRPIMARFISEVAGQLVTLHKAGKKINIATVYEELFLLGLQRDKDKVPILSDLDRADLLTSLAGHLHCQRLGPQSADQLERWFDKFAQSHDGIKLAMSGGNVSTRKLLHTELENASFLVRGNDDRFRFAHTSYYEYFLAQAILRTQTAQELLPFAQNVMSDETLAFVDAICESEGSKDGNIQRWLSILRSDNALVLRQLAFNLLRQSDHKAMFDGANLSGFDLRGFTFDGISRISSADFSGAQLNRIQPSHLRFENCRFDGAILANAALEHCSFVDPKGHPRGLASARGHKTRLPDNWVQDVIGRSRYWEDRENFTGGEIILSSGVQSVGFSPNGARIATGSSDGTARVWDAESGAELLSLKGHGGLVRSVGFSPDGARIVTGSDDGTARVWDAESGSELLSLTGHSGLVQSVAFSPDGARIVTGSYDGTARVWDAESGSELLSLTGHGGLALSVGFSPDGARIVTGSSDGTARVWDAESGSELLSLKGHGRFVQSVGFSPDGARIVTGSSDRTARVWDAESGSELLSLKGHGDLVRSVGFSPDGARIVTGSSDRTARVWDAESGVELLSLKGHGRLVQSVGFSPDGARIVTGSDDGIAWVWDAESGAELLSLKGHGRFVLSVGFSPDGARIVTGSYDGTARVWDAESGAELLSLKGHGDLVRSVGFSPDGARIVTGSSDRTARVWDAESGLELLSLKGHGDFVQSVGFSPDGARIVTGSDDGTARVWDAESGSELLSLKGHGRLVLSVGFSPDGARIVTGSDDGTARVWDAESGSELLSLKGHGRFVQSVGFSPDGARIVTGSSDRTARVWDAESGSELLSLKGHGRFVQSVGFSPDGARIVTGSDDGTARVWDAESGSELLSLKGHGRFVQSVGFSPDGARIVTGSSNGPARVWDASKGERIFSVVSLPNSWAVLGKDDTVRHNGPNFWRYVA